MPAASSVSQEVVDVLRDRPGRLPTRAPVAAEVGGEHPEAGQPLLGQPAEAAAVGHHAVEAEDGGAAGSPHSCVQHAP